MCHCLALFGTLFSHYMRIVAAWLTIYTISNSFHYVFQQFLKNLICMMPNHYWRRTFEYHFNRCLVCKTATFVSQFMSMMAKFSIEYTNDNEGKPLRFVNAIGITKALIVPIHFYLFELIWSTSCNLNIMGYHFNIVLYSREHIFIKV